MCLLLVPLTAWSAESPPRPHIVYLLADDLGWEDVGFQGGEIRTPHLDQLAASGARFDQFYVQPLCSPTRAAFLTGRYPMRLGLQVGVVRPWARYGLPLEERTLPQALREAGYATAIVGKWHLGHFQPDYLPGRRGFDHQYGHYNGAIDYFTHERDGGLDWHRQDRALHEEGYTTQLIAREAVRVLQQHHPRQPLFLYVPFNAVHAPFQVPEPYAHPYAHLAEPRRTYAGMVAAMDEAVGQIIDQLEQQGMRDNTLVIFHSDNGGPQPGVITSNGPFRAGKGTLYEGGVRVAACASWPGHIAPGSVVSPPLHVVDWYPTLLTLAGAPLQQARELDGHDVWATIRTGQPSPRDAVLVNAAPDAGAIRVGQWKLVLNGARERADRQREVAPAPADVIELFDLEQDPYEGTNLADERPDKVAELRLRYDALASQAAPPMIAPAAPDSPAPRVWGEAP